jgi:hypothetical protein
MSCFFSQIYRCVPQLRSKRQLAAKDMMADPKAAIRKIGGLPAMIQLLSEIVQVGVVMIKT